MKRIRGGGWWLGHLLLLHICDLVGESNATHIEKIGVCSYRTGHKKSSDNADITNAKSLTGLNLMFGRMVFFWRRRDQIYILNSGDHGWSVDHICTSFKITVFLTVHAGWPRPFLAVRKGCGKRGSPCVGTKELLARQSEWEDPNLIKLYNKMEFGGKEERLRDRAKKTHRCAGSLPQGMASQLPWVGSALQRFHSFFYIKKARTFFERCEKVYRWSSHMALARKRWF